jgi:hypothetical protein
MANIIKLGNPGSQFTNAAAAQTRMNAASDAQLTQNADANRRANEAAEYQKDQNDRAQAQEGRDATKFAAGVVQTDSTLGGWNKDADRKGWSVALNDSADAIDRLIKDWRRSSGSAKDALSIAGSQQITNFNQARTNHQAMQGLEMAFENASALGEIPDDLMDRYEALMDLFAGGGNQKPGSKGGSSTSPVQQAMTLLRDFNKLAENSRTTAADKQARINLRNEIVPLLDQLEKIGALKRSQKDDWASFGEKEYTDLKDAANVLLDSLNPGTNADGTENTIERTEEILATFQAKLQIYGDPGMNAVMRASGEKAKGDREDQQKASTLSAIISGFPPGPTGGVGDSVFTEWQSMYRTASVHGNGDEFNAGWNDKFLVEKTAQINAIIDSVEKVHGKGTYSRKQMAQMAHEQIVVAERGMAMALTKQGATNTYGGHVTAANKFIAFEFYLKSFGKEQNKQFPASLELTTLADSRAPFITGMAPATSGGGSDLNWGTYSSKSSHPVIGPEYQALFSGHDGYNPVDDGGTTPVPRGRYGIGKIFKDQGKDISDFINLNYGQIYEKDRDLAAAIFKWQSDPLIASGALPPETYFNKWIGKIPGADLVAEALLSQGATRESDKTDKRYLPSSLGKGWAVPGSSAKKPSLGGVASSGPQGPAFDPGKEYDKDQPAQHDDPRFQLTEGPDAIHGADLNAQEGADNDQATLDEFQRENDRLDSESGGTRAGRLDTPEIKRVREKLKGRAPWTRVKVADAKEMGKRLTAVGYEAGDVVKALTQRMDDIPDDTPDRLMDPLIKNLKELGALERRAAQGGRKNAPGSASRMIILKRLSASEARLMEVMDDISGHVAHKGGGSYREPSGPMPDMNVGNGTGPMGPGSGPDRTKKPDSASSEPYKQEVMGWVQKDMDRAPSGDIGEKTEAAVKVMHRLVLSGAIGKGDANKDLLMILLSGNEEALKEALGELGAFDKDGSEARRKSGMAEMRKAKK